MQSWISTRKIVHIRWGHIYIEHGWGGQNKLANSGKSIFSESAPMKHLVWETTWDPDQDFVQTQDVVLCVRDWAPLTVGTWRDAAGVRHAVSGVGVAVMVDKDGLGEVITAFPRR